MNETTASTLATQGSLAAEIGLALAHIRQAKAKYAESADQFTLSIASNLNHAESNLAELVEQVTTV